MNASSLLRRLDADIQATTDAGVADGLRCERAAYLARLGRIDAARAELDEVRARRTATAATPRLDVSIRMHWAEALLAIHAGQAERTAIDRLLRARALAQASGQGAWQARAAVWLAELAGRRFDAAAVGGFVAEALSLAEPADPATRARAALVVARGFHAAGRFERARPCYEEARRQATGIADVATIGDLMSTMAVWRVAELRRHQAAAEAEAVDPAAIEQTRLAAESSANFDARTGLAIRPREPAILQARLLVLAGRFDDALALFEKPDAAAAASDDDASADARATLADRAWCLWRIGRHDAARAAAGEAADWLSTPFAGADRAVDHRRLAAVYDGLGEPAVAALQRGHAERAATRFAAAQDALAAALADALSKP